MKKLLALLFLSIPCFAGLSQIPGTNPAPTPAYIGYAFPANTAFVVAVSSDILINTFTLNGPVTVNGIRYSIGTIAANTRLDFGIYNATGSLITNQGVTTAPGTTGVQTSTVTAVSLSPGIYEIAVQISNASLQIAGVQGAGTGTNPFCNKNTATTMGLPSTITIPGTAGTRCPMLLGMVVNGAP